MTELDFCKGLRVYGVYHFDKYPDINILCTGIESNIDKTGCNYLVGFMFTMDGRMQTMCTLRLPLLGQEIGYVYKPNKGFSLLLEFHNR